MNDNNNRKMILGLTGTLLTIIIVIGFAAVIILSLEIWTENYAWDIPNWGTLLVEIGVAAFAVSISFYFYNRENESRKISDKLIEQQGIRLDELNKSNVKQKEMIESMSEIIDAQQKEIKEKELKKLKNVKYSIDQFIKFLESLNEIGQQFLKIKIDSDKIDKINSSFEMLDQSSLPGGRRAVASLRKLTKEMALDNLKNMLPKFPPFSNVVKLLDSPPDTIDVAIIDITRTFYYSSKEYFEFNEKNLPKILYEDYESIEKFLKIVNDTKEKFQQLIV